MASARRIGLSTARGISQWSRGETAKPWRGIPHWSINKCPFIYLNKNRHLSTNTCREIDYTDVADLLSIPERNYLIRNNGQQVPVSSLTGKTVGLYLCENIPQPPRMKAIKKVYDEARLRGYDFEIVQITFDFNAKHHLSTSPIVHRFREDIAWLSLPSMDPSFKKIQRIFQYAEDKDTYWGGDSLVLIHPPHTGADDILFEFSGAEILERWGIEGYPFTRQSLFKAEYELQKREATLQWFFPPGDCQLLRPRPAGYGFDLVDAFSHLSGKRVLVLFAKHSFGQVFGDNFLSMLKSEYQAQDNVAGESKFEVVYVSTQSPRRSSFDEFTKDMPWLVHPFPSAANKYHLQKVFKPSPRGAAAVAFNEQGELIAKEDHLEEDKEIDKLPFPFIEDLEVRVRQEVEEAFSQPKYGLF